MLSRTDSRALRSVAVQFFVNGVVFASFVPRLPEIRQRIDVDLGQLGLLLTLGSVGGLAGSALVGRVIGRWGTRRTLAVGPIGLIAVLPVVGFGTEWWVFLAAVVGLHFFDVLVDVAMNLQGSWISSRRHAPVMSRLHGLWSLGTVVGGIVSSVAAARAVSLEVHLVAVAVVLVATVAYVVPGLLRTDESASEPEGASGRARSLRRAAVLFGVLGAVTIAMEITASDWAAIRLTDDLGAGAGLAGLGFVAYTTGMVVGRFSGDAVIVRLGAEPMVVGAVALSGAGLAVATLVDVTAVSLAGFVVAGVGNAVLFPLLYDRAAQAPGGPAGALGPMTAGTRVGTLVAPAVVGGLAATATFGVGAAMALVTLPAAAVVLALGRPRD